jgi:putative ATP-binding cassette transporter
MVILDEATSALDSGNERRLYERLCRDGVTLVSIAHRHGVLRHHTHVLRLTGGGAWQLHAAKGYDFDAAEAEAEAEAGAAHAAAVAQADVPAAPATPAASDARAGTRPASPSCAKEPP